MSAPRPRLVSAAYDRGPTDPPTGQVAEDRTARAALLQKEGLIVVDPEEVRDEWLRQAVKIAPTAKLIAACGDSTCSGWGAMREVQVGL